MKVFVSIYFLLGVVSHGFSQLLVEPIGASFERARVQLNGMLQSVDITQKRYPRSVDSAGKLTTTDLKGWTSGFFPGCLWYAGEYLNDKELLAAAEKWTNTLEPLKNFRDHHDLGFMMYNSYGHAYRLTKKDEYKNILILTAQSLATRFDPRTGCIKSWNSFASWHDRNKKYYFPVIIDNMMNLELLFFASKQTGDPDFREIAIKHARSTMKNHLRPDNSSYHVVCYDTSSGEVLTKETGQGYADNSTWARGQAWGIYGFTMTYRETGMEEFLNTAQNMADFFIRKLPKDLIPYWDFNAGQRNYKPGNFSKASHLNKMQKDYSAAAIAASALIELSNYPGKHKKKYKEIAGKILSTLCFDTYRSKPGQNENFILKNSVGSIPNGTEIDVPIIYADYYFLEALKRYKDYYLSKN